jgi:GPH family glycoside/pentoside/hexuronide:cation symporter
MDREKLYFTTKLAYGSGDMGPAITANILVFYLLYFFTNVAGLPAGLASMILAIGKVADAINDPIAGILSDRTRTPWGRRLPWMLWGTIPFGVFFFLQWIVPEFSSDRSANNWWLFIYYVAIGILFNLAYTAVNLPYTALTPELTQDYNERTSLNSFRFAFSIGGSILSLILANLIFYAYPDNPKQQYVVLGIVTTIISMLAILWCTLRIQERGAVPFLNRQAQKIVGYGLVAIAVIGIIYGISQVTTHLLVTVTTVLIGLQLLLFAWTLIAAKTETHLREEQGIIDRHNSAAETTISIKDQLTIAFTNKPFLYIIGIYLCSWLAVQLTASILIYFVVSWMKMSAGDFSLIAIAVQGTALIMLFFWQFVSEKIGKKAVYFIGSGVWMIAQAGLFLIQPGQIGLLYLLAVMAGIGVSVAYLVPWSMIPDVIELDELNTGQRREGIFYSFMVLLQKFGLALALLLVGQALDLAGFISSPTGAPIPQQPESALLAIRIAVGPLPTIALILGLILAYFYPITKEVHDEIRLKLEARKNQG